MYAGSSSGDEVVPSPHLKFQSEVRAKSQVTFAVAIHPNYIDTIERTSYSMTTSAPPRCRLDRPASSIAVTIMVASKVGRIAE